MPESITNFTTLDNLKLKNSQTEPGLNTDEVLVRRDSDDFVRGIPVADLIAGTNTLNAVLIAGNTTDQTAIFTNGAGTTTTSIYPGGMDVNDPVGHKSAAISLGALSVVDTDTQEWFTATENSINLHQNSGFNKFTQNVDALSGADKVVTWRNLSGVPALVSDFEGKFIPIEGTEIGNPVSGDIEVNNGIRIKSPNSSVNDFNYIVIDDSGIQIRSNPSGIYEAQLGVVAGSTTFGDTDPDSHGISGAQDFSSNITDLDYTQKKYVDDAISSATTGVDTSAIMYNDNRNFLDLDMQAKDVENVGLIYAIGSITTESDVIATGQVTGSNLSGTNTGDNAANSNSNAYADAKVENNLTASTSVAPSKTAVNGALILKEDLANKNVSGGYAGLTDWAETAYAQAETWTGTAPITAIAKNWRANRLGKLVTVRINAVYTTPGATVTTVTIPLPTGLPVPSDVTGFTTNLDYISSGSGGLFTATGSMFPATRAALRKISTGNYSIVLTAASGSYSGFVCFFSYFTD